MTNETDYEDSIRQTVIKGARLLDERIPEWYSKIDIEILDIDDLNDCILGQLSDRRLHGTGHVRVWAKRVLGIHAYDPKYGFDGDDQFAHSILREEWVNQIVAREVNRV